MKLITNSNGEITVPAKDYSLSARERISSRSFYINIDTKSGNWPDNRDLDRMFENIILGEISGNLILVDDRYCATGVVILDGKGKDEIDINNHFIWNSKYTSSYKNDLRITTTLVKL
jgi:hypothetical protein